MRWRHTTVIAGCLLFTFFIKSNIDAIATSGHDGWFGNLHTLLLMDDTVILATSRKQMHKSWNYWKKCRWYRFGNPSNQISFYVWEQYRQWRFYFRQCQHLLHWQLIHTWEHQLAADLFVSKFNGISMQNQTIYLSSHHSKPKIVMPPSA